MNRLALILLLSTASLPTATAQTASDATLQALLSEVKQLRIALEKSAVVVPQIQVTLQRLQLQQEVVSRASRDLDEVRNQLATSDRETAGFAAEASALDAAAAREQDPGLRKTLEERARQMKNFKGDFQKASQLRIRESELGSRLRTEQGTLNDLSARLNELERMLEAPGAQR